MPSPPPLIVPVMTMLPSAALIVWLAAVRPIFICSVSVAGLPLKSGPANWMLLPPRTNAPAESLKASPPTIKLERLFVLFNPVPPEKVTDWLFDGTSPFAQLAAVLQVEVGLPPPVQMLGAPMVTLTTPLNE